MTTGRGDQSPRGKSGLLAELWAQLSSDRALITPARYCVYNAAVGVVLLAVAAIILFEPGHGPTVRALALGSVGLALGCGPVVALRRPAALGRLLAFHGLLLVSLALVLAGDSIVWALRAPAHAPFRYAPGLTLLLLGYGTLQIAAHGTPPAAAGRARMRLRRAGLITGVVCELLVLAVLLARAVHS